MKTKLIFKKSLALLSAFVLLITSVIIPVNITAVAEDEYFTLSEDNNCLFVNVSQEIRLSDVSVSVNGVELNGDNVEWTNTNEDISISNGVLVVSKKGIYEITAKDASSNETTIKVFSKEESETAYELYSEDFSDVENGKLPEDWIVGKNSDVTSDEESKHSTYVDSPQVVDGVLYVGNGVANKDTRVYLPAFLEEYSDYAVEMKFSQVYAYNNLRYGGILVRTKREESKVGYYSLMRRAGTKSNSLELCTDDDSKTLEEGAWIANFGPTKSTVTDLWKQQGYKMTVVTTVAGNDYYMDIVRDAGQENFEDDTVEYDPALLASPAISADLSKLAGTEREYTSGGVGIRTTGIQLAVTSIKVYIPLSIISGNPNNYAADEDDGSSEVYDDLKIGLMSDLHMASYETGVDKNLVTMLNEFKDEKVDIVMVLGDVATTGLEEQYEKFNKTWNSVFDDPDTAPKLLAITGNHEFEQAYYHRETVEDVYNKYLAAYGYTEVNQHITMNGYHFIGINSETSSVHGGYTSVTTDWLRAELDKAVAENKWRPIFVMAHQTLPNTTYGSNWGSEKTAAIYNVLKDYPQVIYFGGHSHYPSENERSIFQDLFTAIDVTSLQYTTTESDDDTYESQGALMVTVSGADRQIIVDRYKIDGDSAKKIRKPWVLSLPLKQSTFTYTDDRANDTVAPTFAPDAAVTVSDVGINSAKISFPSASHDDFVQGYNVYIKDSGTTVVTKYFASDFYLNMEKMKSSWTTRIDGLMPNMDYTVEVTAVESFGKESEPITSSFSTLPITTPSAAPNRADFMDVNFAAGFEDNSDYRLSYTLYGSSNQSKIIDSDILGRKVLSACGWINYAILPSMLDKITESFTVEIAFKFPETLPDSKQTLFGNSESGGISVQMSSSGALTVNAYILKEDGSASSKSASIDGIQPDTWYHLIGVYDGQRITAYINGEEVSHKDAVGTVKHNKEVPCMTIGANVNTTGNASEKFIGEIALTRVYTNALTEDEVRDAYKFYQNDNMYQDIYNRMRIIASADASYMDEELKAKAEKQTELAEKYVYDIELSKEDYDNYVLVTDEIIAEITAGNPELGWLTYTDPLSNTGLLTEKSDYWQVEKNKELNKQFISKNFNAETYIMYKVDGYIRSFSVDALIYSGFGDVERDIEVYLSKDGKEWRLLKTVFTDPVNDPIYGPGDAVSWLDSAVSTKNLIGGDYSYIKILVKAFENGIPWSTALDNVVIKYSKDADDQALIKGTFVDEKEKRGDFNGDDRLNTSDAIYLLRHTLKPSDYPLTQSGDVNGDKTVNSGDAIHLLRHILCPGDYPLSDDAE